MYFISKSVFKQEVPPTCKLESLFPMGHFTCYPRCSNEHTAVTVQFSLWIHWAAQVEDGPPLLWFSRQLPPDRKKVCKSQIRVTAAGKYVHVAVLSLAVNVDDCVVECGGAGVWQTVLPLALSMHGMVWAQGAGLGLFQAHQFHRSALTTYGKCGVLLCTRQTGTWRRRGCAFNLNDDSSHSLNVCSTFFGFDQSRITAEDLLRVI